MNILPINALALSMAAQKGIYAALLGSGISRAAGIPTGWEVVIDLIRKLAAARGVDCGPEPDAWYRTEFGREPGYSALLADLAPTDGARMLLLRGYFEPTDEERDRGEKQPTAAHRAIARLVREGHLRVLLTTNFDRLLERAVTDEGIAPTVLSSPSQVIGALPFHQSACTIVKLHGDYLDPRIKNTAEELAAYDPAVRRLLDRVFDEHGLLVCGWSATWDLALREALEARTSRRFPSYWVDVQPLSPLSADLASHLAASFVESAADRFFEGLAESVSAVEDSARQHPANAEVAVARLKRMIVIPADRIRVHDLVMEEAARVHAQLVDDENFPANPKGGNAEAHLRTADSYAHRTGTLLAIAAEGARWGKREHHDLWVEAFEALLEDPRERGGLTWALDMRSLPATLFLYAVGMAVVRSADPEGFKLVSRLYHRTEARRGRQREPVSGLVNPMDVLEGDLLRQTPEYHRKIFAMSRYLHDRLRPVFRGMIRSDAAYTETFDRWEYLLTITLIAGGRGYLGRFAESGFLGESPLYASLAKELAEQGSAWGPVAGGMFDEGAASRALTRIKEAASQSRFGGATW